MFNCNMFQNVIVTCVGSLIVVVFEKDVVNVSESCGITLIVQVTGCVAPTRRRLTSVLTNISYGGGLFNLAE